MNLKKEERIHKKQQEVRELIESKGGEMLEAYEKASVKIPLIASCGCKVEMLISNIKKKDGLIVCKKHAQMEPVEDVIAKLKSIGVEVFTTSESITVSSVEIALMCSCGHPAFVNYKNFKRRAREGVHWCNDCNKFGKITAPTTIKQTKRIKQDKQDVAEQSFIVAMKNAGATVLTPYKDAKTSIKIICSCGHERSGTANVLKKGVIDGKIRCKSCAGKHSHPKWTEDEWRTKALNCGYQSVEFINNMTEVKAIGSCGHEINIKIGGFKKKLQKQVSTCRSCTTQANRDLTEYKIRTLLKNHNCEFKSYSTESRFCLLKYSCGHDGEETVSSLQRKAKDNKKIECTECIMSNKEFTPRDSKPEIELKTYISSLVQGEVKRNYRVSYPFGKEIDVYIPQLNLGFELNGLYWHSTIGGKSTSYHIDKTKFFMEHGIKIIHITDHEWIHKREIISSIIRARVGKSLIAVNARECIIKNISAKEGKSFLDTTHIQGGTGATNSMTYGMFLGHTLVAVMAFRSTKSMGEVELYRFSTMLNFNVRGGFSKMLKHFVNNNAKYTRIITYADIRFSGASPDDTVYAKNGFKYIHSSQPNYKYFRDGRTMLDRRTFQKHKLADKLDIFDKEKTEWENMKANGYNKIYDCGNMVFSLEIEPIT
jgi:hypothetical protein